MESETNTSRIGIEIGAPVDDEKSFIKGALNFGKAAADSQTEKLKALLGTENPNLSAVLVLTPAPGKNLELESLIKDALDGKIESELSELLEVFKSGLVTYKIIHSGSKVILQVKPGPAIEELVTQQVEAVLGLGIEALASTDQTSVSINLASGVDFYDVLEYHKKKVSTPAAFWKSSVAEILVKSNPGSELDKKLLGILKQVVPFIKSTPLPFLQFLKSIDLDVSFRSVDELPEKARQWFGTEGEKAILKFPRMSQDKDYFTTFKKFAEVLEPSWDAYATLDKVAAVHISGNIPGYGVALGTPFKLEED